MLYGVYDNDKEAKYPECNVDPSWDKNKFYTFEDAVDYVHKWIGQHSPGKEKLKDLMVLKPYDYSGFNDLIEIRKLET